MIGSGGYTMLQLEEGTLRSNIGSDPSFDVPAAAARRLAFHSKTATNKAERSRSRGSAMHSSDAVPLPEKPCPRRADQLRQLQPAPARSC